jgi:crotonobetainyl-CoA:carnitine CoA-transferase CaiB-like acyl-CoA transferase
VWLSITGYSDRGDGAHLVAFGDDAAVAGGLVAGSATHPVFCADAIADPLTGLHAALAVVEALRRGGGEVVRIAMAAVAARYAALPVLPGEWSVPAEPPVPPAPSPAASEIGADNARVDRLIDERRLAPC